MIEQKYINELVTAVDIPETANSIGTTPYIIGALVLLIGTISILYVCSNKKNHLTNNKLLY